MKEILERLEIEKAELVDKLTKLATFIESEKFEKVEVNQSRLMTAQIFAMSTYAEILEKRIEFMKYELEK